MMASTDIIGFSFFIILPGCLPALLSLVTVDRLFISSALYLSHTHTPRGTPPHVRFSLLTFSFFPSFLIFVPFQTNPSSLVCFTASSRESPSFHLVLPFLTRAKFLLLVLIWYGCSLHFFGSFVIDRAIRLLNYSTAERRVVWRRAERDID